MLMKLRVAAMMFVLAASMLVGGCDAARRDITVMTYNIHHAAGMDKKLDLARIARVIREEQPDLVALQEVDAGTKRTNGVMQAQELARMLRMRHAYGPAMEYDGGRYGNAILSRHRMRETRVIALPYNPGEQREPRSAVAAIIALPGGREIAFVSTHFDHTSRAPDRLAQAKAINQRLDDLKEPVILAGDFNCEPGSPPMQELARTWTLVSDGDAPTAPADQPRLRIDHVLVKPQAAWRAIESTVIEESVASDHRPVVVKLKLVGN